jgi:hypothetical protein
MEEFLEAVEEEAAAQVPWFPEGAVALEPVAVAVAAAELDKLGQVVVVVYTVVMGEQELQEVLKEMVVEEEALALVGRFLYKTLDH